MGADVAVLVAVLVVVTIVVGFRGITEQRAFQFLLVFLATGSGGQAEQLQWLLQLLAHRRDLGLVGVAVGSVFEADQIHCRAVQLQLQSVAIEHGIELGHAMLVGAEGAVGVVVIVVIIVGMGHGQWQQGEGQGKQQATHG